MANEALDMLRMIVNSYSPEWNYEMGKVGYECAFCRELFKSRSDFLGAAAHRKSCAWAGAFTWLQRHEHQEAAALSAPVSVNQGIDFPDGPGWWGGKGEGDKREFAVWWTEFEVKDGRVLARFGDDDYKVNYSIEQFKNGYRNIKWYRLTMPWQEAPIQTKAEIVKSLEFHLYVASCADDLTSPEMKLLSTALLAVRQLLPKVHVPNA